MSKAHMPPKDELLFEALSADTLDACAEIAQHAPDPWRRADFAAVLEDLNHWSFVASMNGEVVGFACFLAVRESADLQMMAVSPSARKGGIGYRLLVHSLAELQSHHVTRCLLEVRQSNLPARGLYQKLGFRKLATRPGMYTNPAEDGILMARAL